jgi:hypothetical protein
MRRLFLIFLAGTALAGCSMQMPGFLGRGGTGSGTYTLGGEERPDPQPVALRAARVEPALRGIIVRADGVAPTQGYHSAEFVALGGAEPDASGIMSFELTAIPPETPQAIGPANTRGLSAAFFLPSRLARDVRGFRISGAGQVQTLTVPR